MSTTGAAPTTATNTVAQTGLMQVVAQPPPPFLQVPGDSYIP